MAKQNSERTPNTETEARVVLKRVARRLIAEHGVRDVSVRQIAAESAQRNMGAVAYYFRTKDKLISEILVDGATRIEERRRQHLQELESHGGPRSAIEAIEAIVLPSAQFADDDEEYGSYFNQFLLQLLLGKPGFVDQTLEGRWNKGYQRCLKHLRQFMPGFSRAEQNRRLVFLATYTSSLLAQRETMLADREHLHPTWRSDATLLDIISTAAAIVEAPRSE